jgi:hypothetical protein
MRVLGILALMTRTAYITWGLVVWTVDDCDTWRYESEAAKIVWVVIEGQIYEDAATAPWPLSLKLQEYGSPCSG